MSNKQEDRIRLHAMYRRLAYMAVAIVAILLTSAHPVFTFFTDKGIFYTRSYSMDMKTFSVTQTVLDDLDEETKSKTYESKVVGQMSVNGLYVFQKLIFWSCILCVLLFYPTNLRLYISAGIIVLGGVFYGMLIHYAMKISDEFFATLTPTWTAFMPAITMVMMILVHRNVMMYGNYFDDLPDL